MRDIFDRIKGRTFLIVAGLFTVFVISVWVVSIQTNAWEQRNVETRNQVLTSAQADTQDMFDYLQRTSAGRTLVYGTVDTPDTECVSFSETSGCFTYIRKNREKYVPHVETYECGDGKHSRTCTRIVYEWEPAGSEDKTAVNTTFLNESVPYNVVKAEASSVDVSALGLKGSTYYYTSKTERFSYAVVPKTYTGTVWMDLTDGSITQKMTFQMNKTIEQVLTDQSKKPVGPAVTFWILFSLLGIGFLVGSGFLVKKDLDDGIDHTF